LPRPDPRFCASWVSYDADTAFAPVALTGDLYSYLAVNPDLPIADFAQFVAYAKANPGKLSFGSAGNGSLAPRADAANWSSVASLMSSIAAACAALGCAGAKTSTSAT